MFFGQCEPHGRRQSASLLWMLVWKRSWAWMSRRDVREWYGYAFGLPDRHPTTSVVVRFDAHHRQPGFLCWFRVRVVARGGLRTG